jgi:hypothetical protein
MAGMTLSQFEGRDVVDTTVAITKAGDGLSAALEIEPTELHHKQIVQVVLECEVGAVTFKSATEGEGLIRVHKLVTSRATLITRDHELHKASLAALNDMTERLAQAGTAKGSQPGQGSLPQDQPDDDDAEWEDSARSRKGRPADADSMERVTVPDDASELDDELAP